MINLLKVDFKRIFKDKLLIIVCIIALIMSLFTPLLFKGVELLGGFGDDLPKTAFVLGFFANSFSPGSNSGLIVPIFVAIIINKDFTYGTIRNKIICGNKRSNIFLSMYISSAVITISIMLIQALFTLLLSIVLFGGVSFSSGDISYIAQTILYNILLYAFISALVCFLAVWAKNVGLIIVCYVAVSMLCTFAGTIILGVQGFVAQDKAVLDKLLTFINDINLYYGDGGMLSFLTIAGEHGYTLKQVLYKTITPIIYIAGLITVGIVTFNKKDIK